MHLYQNYRHDVFAFTFPPWGSLNLDITRLSVTSVLNIILLVVQMCLHISKLLRYNSISLLAHVTFVIWCPYRTTNGVFLLQLLAFAFLIHPSLCSLATLSVGFSPLPPNLLSPSLDSMYNVSSPVLIVKSSSLLMSLLHRRNWGPCFTSWNTGSFYMVDLINLTCGYQYYTSSTS